MDREYPDECYNPFVDDLRLLANRYKRNPFRRRLVRLLSSAADAIDYLYDMMPVWHFPNDLPAENGSYLVIYDIGGERSAHVALFDKEYTRWVAQGMYPVDITEHVSFWCVIPTMPVLED